MTQTEAAPLTRAQQDLSQAKEALRAWASIENTTPAGIEAIILKRRAVAFRLLQAAPGGADVIAKRCDAQTAPVEQFVYNQILPTLGFEVLTCHGGVEAEPGTLCGYWLFVEDAAGEPYSSSHADHAALAARWLAQMHARAADAARRAAADGALPLREPQHYLQHLADAQQRIQENLANPALSGADRTILADLLRQCDRVTDIRDELIDASSRAPRTLVHGDFVEKNLRIRSAPNKISLMVFDWEVAGFGPAAVDLAECDDLDAYIAAGLTGMPEADLRRLALAGKMFRWSCALAWQSWSLAYEWVQRPMLSMSCFRDDMDRLLTMWGASR